jgi:hypothetical protein
MSWNEVSVGSWDGFTAALEPFLAVYRTPPVYVFRGQSDSSWQLAPSLFRQLRGVRDAAAARKIEELLEQEFQAQASLFPETERVWLALMAAGQAEIWAYMQHHGCPTRLLDWTASAYVAAYFAVDELPDVDGALFVVGAAALDEDFKNRHPDAVNITPDQIIDPSTPERVVFTWPIVRSRRVVAQQGHFSLSTRILATHDGPILESCARIAESRGGVTQQKIIIPAALKLVLLRQLRAMNIAPHALFPTLDGLGKSLADLARLGAERAREAG